MERPVMLALVAIVLVAMGGARVRADAEPDVSVQTVSVPPTTPSPTDPYNFNKEKVDKFFSVLKTQLPCGYPMFGIPSLVPLKLSYSLKTSFDLLTLKKFSVVVSNITVYGLDDFEWDPTRLRFSRTKATATLNLANVTVFAHTSLNGANGTSFLELHNVTLRMDAEYEESDDLLYVTELGGSMLFEDAKVKIASLFPKSSKLSKIWNKAIGKSLPILAELFNNGKLKVEYLSRLLNGAKFYAINTMNNALNSHSLNFDRLIESVNKFADRSADSLMCESTTTAPVTATTTTTASTTTTTTAASEEPVA